jgi:hypothetical protein
MQNLLNPNYHETHIYLNFEKHEFGKHRVFMILKQAKGWFNYSLETFSFLLTYQTLTLL